MMTDDLKVILLGAPRIERGGAPAEIDTRKAIALLAYLVVTGQRHSRDSLAVLLWSEHDQSRARGALRRTLSTLNKALGAGQLDTNRETVGVASDNDMWVDAWHFQQLLARSQPPASAPEAHSIAALTEAVELYRGDFMDGFSLRDSSSFDDWQFLQAERLRRDLAGALERLCTYHTGMHAFALALDYARRWLALDPLHEPAHCQLMLLYAWADQRAAALNQYRMCVRILDQELGVPPLEETTQLYQAIKEHGAPPLPERRLSASTSPTHSPAGAPNAGSTADSPAATEPVLPALPALPALPTLIGRAAELATLLDSYAAIGADGRLIVLEGEAGIGKTRLAEELLAAARQRGATTMIARCYAGEANLAYGVVLDLLRAALSQPQRDAWLRQLPATLLSEVARLLPELANLRPDLPPAPPLDTLGAQSRFFESVSQVVLSACQGRAPGMLLLDDLHWADSASLDVLAYLVRRLRGQPLCILVTWRSESMPAAHRARALLAESQRSGVAALLSLARLSRGAVLELVYAAGVADPARANAIGARLYVESEGLPFFVIAYLSTLAREQAHSNLDAWPTPSGVRDLLRSRLAAVSETGMQLLTTAAVIGRSFDYATLHAASGRGEEEVVEALDHLLADGLVQEASTGIAHDSRAPVYDFYHEQLRALVYDQASLARRRLLHRRVAEALIGRARGQPESGALASQVAQHYQLAGHAASAADYFRLAGEHARQLYANAEALAHFQAALALGHPDAAAIHEAIGDLHTLRGEYSAALTSYETAAAFDAPAANPKIERKLGVIHGRRGAWDLAESHIRAALDALDAGDHSAERARLYADWGLAAYRRAQPEQALALAQQALALAEQANDMRALVETHNTLGIIFSRLGELATARSHLERSLALAESLGEPAARVAALNNLALACAAAGEPQRAITLVEQAVALCVTQGDRHHEAALRNNLADLLYAAGQGDPAMAQLKQAVAIFAEIGADAGEMQPEIWKLVEW